MTSSLSCLSARWTACRTSLCRCSRANRWRAGCDARPGSRRCRRRIGRETAEGLAAAHAAGLVHRDVKPSICGWNRRGTGEWVKVLDFGLARPIEDVEHLTGTAVAVGTVGYMAPEQARAEAVDGQTDLFSLGCVLYRMCTGKPAFQGATLTAVLNPAGTNNARAAGCGSVGAGGAVGPRHAAVEQGPEGAAGIGVGNGQRPAGDRASDPHGTHGVFARGRRAGPRRCKGRRPDARVGTHRRYDSGGAAAKAPSPIRADVLRFHHSWPVVFC